MIKTLMFSKQNFRSKTCCFLNKLLYTVQQEKGNISNLQATIYYFVYSVYKYQGRDRRLLKFSFMHDPSKNDVTSGLKCASQLNLQSEKMTFRLVTPSPQKVRVSNSCTVTIMYIFCVLDQLGQMFMNLQLTQRAVSKVNSNTDPLVELEKIASGKGFVISHNEGSGNCMYHALSEQLNLVKGIKISHGDLRQSIVQHLLNNPRMVSLVCHFVVKDYCR